MGIQLSKDQGLKCTVYKIVGKENCYLLGPEDKNKKVSQLSSAMGSIMPSINQVMFEDLMFLHDEEKKLQTAFYNMCLASDIKTVPVFEINEDRYFPESHVGPMSVLIAMVLGLVDMTAIMQCFLVYAWSLYAYASVTFKHMKVTPLQAHSQKVQGYNCDSDFFNDTDYNQERYEKAADAFLAVGANTLLCCTEKNFDPVLGRLKEREVEVEPCVFTK